MDVFNLANYCYYTSVANKATP